MVSRSSPNPGARFVRCASTADGPSIGTVHAAAWEEGFGHMLDADFLARACAGRREGWGDAIAVILGLQNLVLVAGQGADVRAYSQSGEPDDGEGLEIFAFSCHPADWGTGLAGALMHETCGVLALRASRAVLWTPVAAHRAQRFYERCGFAPTGRRRVETLGDWQPVPTSRDVEAIEYARPLG